MLLYSVLSVFYLLWNIVLCTDISDKVFTKVVTSDLPAAFGDFNADKLTDIFVIEKKTDSSIVKVLLAHSTEPAFRSADIFCNLNSSVSSVVPSDFDGDGAMDVLLLSLVDGVYEAVVLWGSLNTLDCNPMVVASFKSQPLLLDYNGDSIADLLAETPDGRRFYYVFGNKRSKPITIPMVSQDSKEKLPGLRLSGGHAFVDVDQDLAADIWLSVEGRFELWPTTDDEMQVIELPTVNDKTPAVLGQASFFDVNHDGNMEVVLPVCVDAACDKSSILLRSFSNTTNGWVDLGVVLKDDDDTEWRFHGSNDMSFYYTETITARVGDLNLDGFPDLLVTLFSSSAVPRVVPLMNVPCIGPECKFARTFSPKWNEFKGWPRSSVLGAFFDFFEDGVMDVLIVTASDPIGSKRNYSMHAIKPTEEYDAMFIKVLVLTSVCYDKCPHGSTPYGTNQPGSAISYSMVGPEGGYLTARHTQMTRTGHFALELPYTVLGLGRNWNFIDEMSVGLPKSRENITLTNMTKLPFHNHGVASETFTQIIPNSQVVVIPVPRWRPLVWKTKMVITPSRALLLTAVSLVATCGVVAIVVGALHMRERHENKREKRQQAQRFHFDAM